jgi:hypothetical protein
MSSEEHPDSSPGGRIQNPFPLLTDEAGEGSRTGTDSMAIVGGTNPRRSNNAGFTRAGPDSAQGSVVDTAAALRLRAGDSDETVM